MMVVANVPGAAVLGQSHVVNPFALQVSSETLNFRPSIAEDQNFRSPPIKARAGGVFSPDFSDSALDIRVFVPTRPTLVFSFHGRGETVQFR